MYKDIVKQIKGENIEKSEKDFSEQDVLNMIAHLLMSKSEEYTDVDIEELRKNWKNAFKTGLTVLGMIHGAHYIGQGQQAKKQPITPKVRESQQREIKQAGDQARSEAEAIFKKSDNREKNIGKFLKNISMIESSGGKNTNHREMKAGIHSGDSAIGSYGLMPNTIKEMAGRMGKKHPLNAYSKMDSNSITDSIKKNPDHEHGIAKFMANHLHDKFGGDENKMAYSWNQGHNLENKHFDTTRKDYINHDYVKKFNKNKSTPEKPPALPKNDNLASN